MRRGESTGRRCTAISLLALLFVLVFGVVSFAGIRAGVVSQLSGPLFAKKADGTTRVLSINAVVELGDTLVTEKGTYARIRFTDNGEITMRPSTQFRISDYHFDQAEPRRDRFVFNFIRGSLRSLTGWIGKRGDQDSYRMVTPTAVTGIRGTTYDVRICEGNCGAVPDGLYFYVIEGIINVRNEAGSQDVSAGQYAYVASATAMPRILPGDPGLDFRIPPSFGGAAGGGGSDAPPGAPPGSPQDAEADAAQGCEVR